MAKNKGRMPEKKIDELFVVVKGFNITEKGGEKRFDTGTEDKPVFVTEKDFSPEDWRILKHEKAVVLFEDDTLRPNENIAAEIFE